jgi:hypothetical protein
MCDESKPQVELKLNVVKTVDLMPIIDQPEVAVPLPYIPQPEVHVVDTSA